MAAIRKAIPSPVSVALSRSVKFVSDLLLPRRCIACGEVVESEGAFCASCWPEIRFLSEPLCSACGFPFEFDHGVDAICGACHREPPLYHRARAVFRYDDTSRNALLAFKHSDRTDVAPAFAGMMAQAGASFLAEADLIVPVPLHRRRLLSRRYNQSAILALALGKMTLVPAFPDLLVRTRATPSQSGLGAKARHRNVAGAFALRNDMAKKILDKRVLLIDDVMTTGATVLACTKTLLAGGAASVDVLTLARVVRPASD
ncbi:MAG: amidophosphoribosyltransferase [Rhodospirillaceae bacterium]|nr:amidophosphoribosyltransferase [Rhodospirillaceae bacterium]|tara:strand:- start:34881 stop:35657 length:777 start_codon:yes stop_codon:yes gene_type:complete